MLLLGLGITKIDMGRGNTLRLSKSILNEVVVNSQVDIWKIYCTPNNFGQIVTCIARDIKLVYIYRNVYMYHLQIHKSNPKSKENESIHTYIRIELLRTDRPMNELIRIELTWTYIRTYTHIYEYVIVPKNFLQIRSFSRSGSLQNIYDTYIQTYTHIYVYIIRVRSPPDPAPFQIWWRLWRR